MSHLNVAPRNAVYIVTFDLDDDASVCSSMGVIERNGKKCGHQRWERKNRVDVWSELSYTHAKSYYFRNRDAIKKEAGPSKSNDMFGGF